MNNTLTHIARARVTIQSLRLERDDYGRKVAHLRLRQPSTGTLVSAIATKPTIIDTLMNGGPNMLWRAVIDTSERGRKVLLDARRIAA